MIDIERQHLDYHSGQHEYVLRARLDGEPAGTLAYTLFEAEVHVKMIEASIPRCGVGTALLVALQDFHPDQMINFGMLTEDGKALLDSLEWDVRVNNDHKDAAWELAEIEARLKSYSVRFDALANALQNEKASFLSECADWNELHDRAEILADIVNTTPDVFRVITGPRPSPAAIIP